MNRTLLHHFNKLESAKGAVLTELRNWPEERLGIQPASGSWSTLEVIEHVILTEQSILGVMRRHLEKPQRIRFKDWLGNARVLGVMLLPMQVRIPRGARAVAPTGQTSDLADA